MGEPAEGSGRVDAQVDGDVVYPDRGKSQGPVPTEGQAQVDVAREYADGGASRYGAAGLNDNVRGPGPVVGDTEQGGHRPVEERGHGPADGCIYAGRGAQQQLNVVGEEEWERA